jgi:two-component system CAI-1 autoinducer sensor kinase/phosphatase CqsS
MVPFGVFGLIAYSLFYFLNHYLFNPSGYDNPGLRIAIALLCLGLVFKNQWPKQFKSALPYYWLFTLTFTMPFFITFLTLKNHGAAPWVLNELAVFILMMLLVDWKTYSASLLSGIFAAWVCFVATTPEGFIFIPGTITYADILNTFPISIIMGIVFSRSHAMYEKGKLEAMQSVSASIAHELRTPLAAVRTLAEGLQDYLPDLVKAYEFAEKEQLPITKIRKSQLDFIGNSLHHVKTEINLANTFINMLMVKVDLSELEADDLEHCYINDTIQNAISRYPFHGKEKELIHWQPKVNFKYYGKELLIIHVLFNLFKNSLHAVAVAGKGEITIWTVEGKNYNELHFKDTGTGIPDKVLSKIFERFFTNTTHGSGIGLQYCKAVMHAIEGKITANSVEMEYAEFVLYFPKTQMSKCRRPYE